ncbi:TadE/TadG family protein [Jannaschia donghaensis]|uniref:Flp pilus assembly protein TadG n=1 Tax=Jannaschia donghaensis TaxID=420998 RepID=A0A0M6YJM3_9RHOB|nr:TadE/TadG family type IV pilus assembly protein [Jannaschia donghaensis]CTQ49999.1 Flp pilus assembly protein TadG [Jannaschia donghaensis]
MIDTSTRRAPNWAVLDFYKREDGSLTIFGLMIFLLMMTAGGIALDIMRSEVKRTELQYAVDRASLAAAGLDQTRSAEEIVKDYVRAAGLDEDSIQVTTTQVGSDRRVSVSSNAETNSLFLDMLGYDTLVQPVSSEAREVRTELELSLVVDISGSMGGAKIESLHTAASDFVAQLLQGREDLTSISLVPYNDRVNAGSLVNGVFDITDEHVFSNCVVFADDEFNTTAMGPGDELQRMGHFDFRSGNVNAVGLVEQPNCLTDNYAAILPWSNNVAELQSRIGDLRASHWTAMDLGVKWGSLLLDPSSKDELTELANSVDIPLAEQVSTDFVGRPVAYSTVDTHKVLVVMTDGVNTQQWDLKHDRKSGGSKIHIYREALVDMCVGYDNDEDPVWNYYIDRNGNRRWYQEDRNDGFSSADAELCKDWHEAGQPSPYDDATEAPTLASIDDGSPIPALREDIRGTQIAINRYGFNGAGCAFGTEQQRGYCLARFDDHEGHTYVTRYSIWSQDVGKYYVTHLKGYRNGKYGGTDAIELSWPQALSSLSMSYIANTLLGGAAWNTRVDYFYSWETTHGQERADNNLSNICKAARDAGVVIYTIAFQAPEDGQAAMLDCAGEGNEGSYFDVEDLDIAAAFDDVLASVSRLRLTQ